MVVIANWPDVGSTLLADCPFDQFNHHHPRLTAQLAKFITSDQGTSSDLCAHSCLVAHTRVAICAARFVVTLERLARSSACGQSPPPPSTTRATHQRSLRRCRCCIRPFSVIVRHLFAVISVAVNVGRSEWWLLPSAGQICLVIIGFHNTISSHQPHQPHKSALFPSTPLTINC